MKPETVAPPPEPSPEGSPLVSVQDLKTYYTIRGSFIDRLVGREAGIVRAVDGVSLDIRRGEVLGLVGESGSGKTTLGRTLLGLVRSTSGSMQFDGQELAGRSEREWRDLRRQIQVVFQDPHASLNPAMTIEQAVGHPLEIHGLARSREQRRARVIEVLEHCGLAPGADFLDKYPSDLSGGQKQRVVIARAIILNPALLVADEPVSMLDMSVRAKILELMIALKRDLELTYLYITHDLATARFFCDRIAIMYLGKVVEIGPAEAIYADPKHPYTQALLRAIPEPDPERAVPRDLPRGEVPDAAMPPLGCPFHPRCARAFEPCGWESRDLRDLLEMRWALAAGAAAATVVEEEQALVGDLGVLARPATNVRLSAGRKAADIAALLDRIRDEDPEEPFWRGVERIGTDELNVNIDFHEPRVPQLEPVGEVDVSCHLYDSPPAQA
jgi:peptide/nickel transport system ATP-binding protein